MTQRRDELILPLAGLSFAAGCIHAIAMVDHFEEYWLFGLFFAMLTPLQLAFAVALYVRPGDRLLQWAALGNLAIAAVWVASRTIGLPFGPEPWTPESVGVADLLATVDELAIAALVAAALGWRPLEQLARRGAFPISFALMAASILSAMTLGHVH